MKKQLIPVIAALLLTLVFSVCYIVSSAHDDILMECLSFSVSDEASDVHLSLWKKDDSSYYLFLPSFADTSSLKPLIRGISGVTIDEQPIDGHSDLSFLKPGSTYALRASRFFSKTDATLTVLQSTGVPTLFISTETGSMEKINANKSHEEAAAVFLFDSAGKLQYSGNGKDAVHGRGQTTWAKEKKPYHLTLEASESLLGMHPGRHWLLLANAMDATHFRNRIVSDTAGFTGLADTPQCEYVELFLNGSYNGLYLLSEQINAGISDQENPENGFLFEVTNKESGEDPGFITKANRNIRLRQPKNCTEEQLGFIKTLVQEMETGIRSLSGTSEWPDRLDLPSFAARYLVDEFFINMDSDMASSFYRWDGASGLFLAGPVWDYDISCGSTANIWTAQSRYPDQLYAASKYYYGYLCSSPAFTDAVRKVYRDSFLPAFLDYLKTEFPSLTERIRSASETDRARWPKLYRSSEDQSIPFLVSFFEDRIRYLNAVWVDGIQYCSVWLCNESKSVSGHCAVPKGTTLSSLPRPEQIVETESGVWYVRGTDDPVCADDLEKEELYLCPIPETEFANRPKPAQDFGDEEEMPKGLTEYVVRVIRHEWDKIVPLLGLLLILLILAVYYLRESTKRKGQVRKQ